MSDQPLLTIGTLRLDASALAVITSGTISFSCVIAIGQTIAELVGYYRNRSNTTGSEQTAAAPMNEGESSIENDA
jgi:hypothetical protein